MKTNTKHDRYMESRDVVAFLKIIKEIFPDACKGDDATLWDWSQVGTSGGLTPMFAKKMEEAFDADEEGKVFRKWNLRAGYPALQNKLCSFISTVRRAVFYYENKQTTTIQ